MQVVQKRNGRRNSPTMEVHFSINLLEFLLRLDGIGQAIAKKLEAGHVIPKRHTSHIGKDYMFWSDSMDNMALKKRMRL